MRRSHSVVAAALALLVAPAWAPVRAEAPWGAPDGGYAVEEPYQPEDAPDPGRYREELGPYGDWHDVPDYGVVWRPTSISGWQPYMDGYWAWTSHGWTWISYEPWAWTLHYGRWVTLPAYGWVWVPGTVWGPAWVDWYWGAGYVGWAPLSPFGRVTVINSFVFVTEGDFCSRNVRRHVVRHHRVSDRVHRDWHARDHRRPPRHDRIERVSRHTVTRLDGRPRETLAPRRDRDRRPARPALRPDLTEARRDRRDERRVRDTEPRTASRPAWGADDGARRRGATRVRERQPRLDADDAPTLRRPAAPSWSRRPRETAPERAEPRVRGPRFDRDDAGRIQVRPHAWEGGGVRRNPRLVTDGPASRLRGPETARSGGQRQTGGRHDGGGRANARGGAARMSLTPGAR